MHTIDHIERLIDEMNDFANVASKSNCPTIVTVPTWRLTEWSRVLDSLKQELAPIRWEIEQAQRKASLANRVCARCGKPVVGRQATARFCSSSCSQAWHCDEARKRRRS